MRAAELAAERLDRVEKRHMDRRRIVVCAPDKTQTTWVVFMEVTRDYLAEKAEAE
jgi:hypothetical protein